MKLVRCFIFAQLVLAMAMATAPLPFNGQFAGIALAAQTPFITIKGNVKTQTKIIAQELVNASGAVYSQQDAENSQKAIMALGLFESVTVELKDETGHPELEITVKEKRHDWYVLPRINRNGDGDVTLGADWRENNWNGLNQRVRLTVAQKKYQQASRDKESRIKFQFIYPRIVGTNFSASFDTTLLNVSIDDERDGLQGLYDRNKISIGSGIGRWFGEARASKGLQIYLGGRFTRYDHKLEEGDPGLYFDATIVAVEARANYREIYDNLFSRSGHEFGLRIDKADKGMGSDVDFLHQTAYYRRYMPVGSRPHTNFNYQIQIGSGDRSVFGDPIYDLSGSVAVRGFARETLEGDAFFVINTEYLRPLFGKSNLRGALLLDVGNAYPTLSDLSDTGFEVGAGFGLRWKLKSWVNVELRIDAAYGFGDLGGSRVYVSTDSFF